MIKISRLLMLFLGLWISGIGAIGLLIGLPLNLFAVTIQKFDWVTGHSNAFLLQISFCFLGFGLGLISSTWGLGKARSVYERVTNKVGQS